MKKTKQASNADCGEVYLTFQKRIKSADRGQLKRYEDKITMFYENGLLTPHQLGKLDVQIMEKLANV